MTSPTSNGGAPAADLSFAATAGDPAGLLPAQSATRPPTTGELRLMAAVLAQALDDDRRGARDGRPAAQLLRRRSRAWFASSDPDWPYSFERICAALGLDADAIRERLAATATQRAACYRRVTRPRTPSLAPPATAPLERRVA